MNVGDDGDVAAWAVLLDKVTLIMTAIADRMRRLVRNCACCNFVCK
jgi:hypothetical protein